MTPATRAALAAACERGYRRDRLTHAQEQAAQDAWDAEYQHQLDDYKHSTPRERRISALLASIDALIECGALKQDDPIEINKTCIVCGRRTRGGAVLCFKCRRKRTRKENATTN